MSQPYTKIQHLRGDELTVCSRCGTGHRADSWCTATAECRAAIDVAVAERDAYVRRVVNQMLDGEVKPSDDQRAAARAFLSDTRPPVLGALGLSALF